MIGTCDGCGKTGNLTRLPRTAVCEDCLEKLKSTTVRQEPSPQAGINDSDYKLIGEAFENLLFEEDIARIGNLLYHASRTHSNTASQLYLETYRRFLKAAQILRKVRIRCKDV